MSHLSTKSAANLNASSLLISNNYHAASVHCSYYAMLQNMTCKMKDSLKISFEMILQNSKGPGSHEYVINETIGIIRASVKDLEPILKNVELTNIQKLRKNIGDLKLFRVQSDYHDVEIDPTTSNKALVLSQNIISKINTFLA